MKKKPIYLWVLLVLSAISSFLAVVGILTPVPSKDALRASQENVGTLTAQQIEDAVNYAHQVSESSHSIFNTILIILSAILVGLVHDNMNLQDAMQLIKDDTLRLGMEVMSKVTTIIFIVINVIFLGIVFYKIWRQQKELTEAQEEEELA